MIDNDLYDRLLVIASLFHLDAKELEKETKSLGNLYDATAKMLGTSRSYVKRIAHASLYSYNKKGWL